jgi:predicted amidohydrolase
MKQWSATLAPQPRLKAPNVLFADPLTHCSIVSLCHCVRNFVFAASRESSFALRLERTQMRIALATLRFRPNPDDALRAVVDAMHEAASHKARIVCTAECYLPGLRGVGLDVAAPDADFLARAERTIRETAAATGVAAVVGVERVTTAGLIASAMIVARDGQLLGFQDKVQIDPSEEGTYTSGHGRKMFEIDGLRFGVAICHEGWRYPETVRWAARRGAQIVFHPQFSPTGDSARTADE